MVLGHLDLGLIPRLCHCSWASSIGIDIMFCIPYQLLWSMLMLLGEGGVFWSPYVFSSSQVSPFSQFFLRNRTKHTHVRSFYFLWFFIIVCVPCSHLCRVWVIRRVQVSTHHLSPKGTIDNKFIFETICSRLEGKPDRDHIVSYENHDSLYCNFWLVDVFVLVINEETSLWGYKRTIICLFKNVYNSWGFWNWKHYMEGHLDGSIGPHLESLL